MRSTRLLILLILISGAEFPEIQAAPISGCLHGVLEDYIEVSARFGGTVNQEKFDRILAVKSRSRKVFNETLSNRDVIVEVSAIDRMPYDEWRISIKNHLGQELGHIKYQIISEKEELHIWDMKIDDDFRNEGISKILLARALMDHPEVNVINSGLVGTNRAVYKTSSEFGLSHKARLKKTPAYKIRADLGFGKLEDSKQAGFIELKTSWGAD